MRFTNLYNGFLKTAEITHQRRGETGMGIGVHIELHDPACRIIFTNEIFIDPIVVGGQTLFNGKLLSEHDISPIVGCLYIYTWKNHGATCATYQYMREMARSAVLTP
ncbi:hypothetical protein [Thiolapillus sp.]